MMVKNISGEEAMALIEKGARIVDIREKNEFSKKHLNGSINVDISDIDRIQQIYPYRDEDIIIICASGIRSIAVAEKLSELGYKKVYNLFGGFKGIM